MGECKSLCCVRVLRETRRKMSTLRNAAKRIEHKERAQPYVLVVLLYIQMSCVLCYVDTMCVC